MEQKKTLWIIAAVGAFLLVVLGAACILYSPTSKPYSTVAQIVPAEPKKTSQNGWTNPPVAPEKVSAPSPVQAPQDLTVATKVNDMVVVADNATVYGMNTDIPQPAVTEGTTIDLNALKRELYQEVPVTSQPQNINITVNIPEQPVKETTTYINATPEYKAEPEKAVAAAEPKKVEKAVSVSKPVEKAKPAAVAQAPKKEVKAEPKKITQFWVQVAAYSNKKGAESARSILDENKIPADIFTYKDNKDKLYYRVRVGPYTTKSEAEYWKTKIVKIDDFAKSESYVTSTLK